MYAPSRSSGYALRALTWLAARHAADEHYLLSDIAWELEVPEAYLGKLLQLFVASGLLASRRGRHGGFRLQVEPASVKLIEIVETVDGESGERICVLGKVRCTDDEPCLVHQEWALCSETLRQRMSTTSLAEMVEHQSER